MVGNSQISHRTVHANGIDVHVAEQGEGYPVVFCHGFPELWYSWRHELPALAGAGFHAIAPDLRGYGDSDKPAALEDYDLPHLVGDLVGLLDALDIEKAVAVGHDWGSIIVWAAALMHPERFERLASLNVPYRGHASMFPTIETLKQVAAERFNYVIFFQEPGVAEATMGKDLAGSLKRMYQLVAHDKDFLSDDEFAVFLRAFEKGGLTGPINFYHNIDRNNEMMQPYNQKTITQPTLMITADNDPVLPPEGAQGMEQFVPNVQVEAVTKCGHWTQQEKPQEVNRYLIDFLRDLAK